MMVVFDRVPLGYYFSLLHFSEDTTALIDIVFIDDESGECNSYDYRSL